METIFDTNATGSVKKAAAEAGAKSSDLWQVPYKELRIADGFNLREKGWPKYKAHVEWLKGQMISRGYDRTKPMAGYVVNENGSNVFYVTDGHSRHLAFGQAIESNPELSEDTLIPMIVHPAGTNAEDLTVSLLTSATGKPLEPLENANGIKRLLDYGWDEKRVAERLGYTVAYVKQLLELLSAPKAVREMVKKGEVSATLAVKTVRKSGSEAAKVLKKGLSEAQAKGKTKVTEKHVKLKKEKTLADCVSEATGKPIGEVQAELAAVTNDIQQMQYISSLRALLRDMTEYIKAVRVGDDAADLIARADAVLNDGVDDDTKQMQLPLEDQQKGDDL
jgi:ParB-like chromosome segregation protein Spo0J